MKPAVVVLFFQFVKIDLIFVTVICAGSATWNKPHDRNERKPMLDIASVKSSNIDITINACKISILYPTNQEIDNKNKSIYFVLCSLTDSKLFFRTISQILFHNMTPTGVEHNFSMQQFFHKYFCHILFFSIFVSSSRRKWCNSHWDSH